jgi:hypothetical protein
MGQTLPIVGQSVGGGLMVAAPFTGPAAPFVLAAGALTSLFSKIFGSPDTAEMMSTQIVNQAEPYFQANVKAFQNGQIDKTTALDNFDQMWSQLVSAEGDPRTKNHGAIAIGDRSPGGKWDWFSYYRTPISSAPDVSITDTSLTMAGGIPLWGWIAGGLVLVLLVSGDK